MGRWEERKKSAFCPCPQAYEYRENNRFYLLNICYRTYNSFQDSVCLHFTNEETGCDEIFFQVQWGHVSVSYCSITNHPKTWWLKTINIYCLTVSLSQEFRHSLLGWSVSGSLMRLLSGYQCGPPSPEGLAGLQDQLPRWPVHRVLVTGRRPWVIYTWTSPPAS